MRTLCWLLVIGWACGVATPAWGQAHASKQPPKPKPAKPAAYTTEAEAGVDFQLQGEYGGLVAGPYRQQRIGLQVIALGDGNFRAVEFAGGLPGDGWNGEDRVEYEGRRQGRIAIFTGPKRYGVIVPGMVWMREAGSDTLLGTLKKVHRRSSTLGLQPPSNAVVLFNGTSTEQFVGAKITEDGLLMEGPATRDPVGDFRLHLEFRLPFMPAARGQARSNSGVYIQRRYEVQILDSFGLEPQFNDCASLYRQRPPALNMCLPPLSWQTYDIEFRAARFDGQGRKIQNARITVRLNGVAVQNNVELTSKTGAGQPEAPHPLPILLQNHGNPVRFRNIWIEHLDSSSELPPLVAGYR